MLRLAIRSTRSVVSGAPLASSRVALARRGLASESSVATTTTATTAPAAVKPKEDVVVSAKATASSSSASSAPAPKPAPKPAGASLGSRIGVFLAGIGVGAGIAFFNIHSEIWESTTQIEKAVDVLKADVVNTNTELRERVAALEHEVASLKSKN